MIHMTRTVFALLMVAAPVFAQTSSLSGSVVDPAGAPVIAATVRAKDTTSGATVTAPTSREGRYSFASLAPGTYDLSITGVTAMTNVEQKGVKLGAQPMVVNLKMDYNGQLGTIGEDRISLAADAQRHNPPAGPTPRTKDGKPDLSGVWWRPSDVDGGGPQFLPAADAIAKQRRDAGSRDNPQVRCLPGSATRFGPLFQMVQSQDYLVIINDDESPGFHQAYINGKHPDDPNPAWYGHNTAHWDEDTLVVDRVAFDERIWLDQAGHPHSPNLHIVERYRRPSLGRMEMEVTVEDPGILTKPYTIKRVADLAQGYNIYEFICAENERDFAHMNSK
jgi:hypothetical protein